MKIITFLAIHFLQGSSLLLEQVIPPSEDPVCSGHELEYQCIANANSVVWLEDNAGITLLKSDTDPRFIDRFEFQVKTSNESLLLSTATLPKASSLDEGIEIVCSAEGTIRTETINVARGPESCVGVVNCCFIQGKLVVSLEVPFDLMCAERYLFEFDSQNKTCDTGQNFAMFEMDTTTGGVTFLNQMVLTLDYENRTGQHPCLYNILAPNSVEHIFASRENNGANINVHINIVRPTFPIGSCLSPENVTWSYNVSTNMTSNSSKVADDYVIYYDVPAETYEVIVVPTVVELNLSADPYSTHFVVNDLPITTIKETETITTVVIEATTSVVPGDVLGLSVALSIFVIASFVLGVAVLVLLVVLYYREKKNKKDTFAVGVPNATGGGVEKLEVPEAKEPTGVFAIICSEPMKEES